MATNLSFDGGSPFRIKRPLITTSGFVSDVDATIKTHLDELNTILGRRIFTRQGTQGGQGSDPRKANETFIEEPPEAKVAARPGSRRNSEKNAVTPEIKELLARPLTPKLIPHGWSGHSIVHEFKHTEESPEKLTLADYIDMTAELSSLKYAFQGNLTANWFNLDYNTKTVLDGYDAITDYLVAFAFHMMDLHDVNALKNFILSNRLGAKNVASYAIVSAARTIIDAEQLKVPNFNVDDSDIVARIKTGGLSLSSASFKSGLQTIINDDIFNSKEAQLISDAENGGLGKLPDTIKPMLIKYIKASAITITTTNASFFLPMFIQQIQGQTQILSQPTEVSQAESDKDFEVNFLEDDNSVIQISKSAVLCAAQLYYGMILGDELNVFEVVNYFTHKYLVSGRLEIQDAALRDDLKLYVFSNKFSQETKDHRIVINDRMRPAERLMFYRQVFDYGRGQVSDEVIVNTEFPRLWKVLILESAKYLERAQAAFNPDSYVSRQNVMQAVEDLQYNLSTHCTGMANVITPLIYAELDFVIRRILMHPEVMRQIVPQGSTWWRVVEMLYMGMNHTRPKATVLYNKAKLGTAIIRSIADYNPTTFEDDRSFSEFISNVDAFITTQSILQEALTDSLREGQEEDGDKYNGNHPAAPETEPTTAPSGTKTDDDEWDF